MILLFFIFEVDYIFYFDALEGIYFILLFLKAITSSF